ncbi:MAG: hypothetical protein CVT62_13555 [Actinobacteria bacterium HGW-Actinobacteria-2]|nr:MAG: hypothetical protein CVT62_13555 [Actinobacteria bacterium HGW-Actinobacteria-2]
MTASALLVRQLVETHPDIAGLLSEHLEDNEGELLPHLLLADIIRWLVSHRTTKAQVCASVLNYLDAAFAAGPDEVRGLIQVSGVEMIPDPGQPGAELRAMLGPSLASVDPWREVTGG